MKLSPIKFMSRCRSAAPRPKPESEPRYDGPVCPVCRTDNPKDFTLRVLEGYPEGMKVSRIECKPCGSKGTVIIPDNDPDVHVYWWPVDIALKMFATEQAKKDK